jgi:hypothetical protein
VTVQAAGKLHLKASQISIQSAGPTTVTSAATLTLRGALVQIN